MHRIKDEDPDTRANAAYALGLLCLSSENRQLVLSQYNAILQTLEGSLNRSSDGGNGRALDNAAGCVARMIMASPDNVPLAEFLPALAGVLPLCEDYEENDPIFKMLVKLCKLSHSGSCAF